MYRLVTRSPFSVKASVVHPRRWPARLVRLIRSVPKTRGRPGPRLSAGTIGGNDQSAASHRNRLTTDLPASNESVGNAIIAAILLDGDVPWRSDSDTPEPIFSKLREAEVKLAKGTALAQACKDLAVTEQTCYRWPKQCGGLERDQAERLEQLEGRNARLRRLLADAELDRAILKEAASGRS